MDYERVAYLLGHSSAWRLLRADTAPLILAVLGHIFVVDNVRTISEPDLLARVEDELHAINTGLGGLGEKPAYPRSPREYVASWSAPEQGWLRKFYPATETTPAYDATSDLEKAYAWVVGLQQRVFVGTESRLHTLVDLLRQMVHGSDADPAGRVARLKAERARLDAEIAQAEAGHLTTLDSVALLDRYQHFSSTARGLLADFREVEENFRALDRGAREKITAWDGSKGELLEQLVGDRHAITASEQGRSFQAFHDFLLSRQRQDELTDLLDRLVELDDIPVDRAVRHVHHDWGDAAERTQQTVRQLSEQLRRFLDDKVWLENRRVMDLLRSLERTALSLREVGPDVEMELDALTPTVRLPMERPLYAPSSSEGFDDSIPLDGDEDVDASALFSQVYVDHMRLAANVRAALHGRDQIALTDILRDHPPVLGVAEILGYLTLDADDLDVVTDEQVRIAVPFTDVSGRPRLVRMPQVTLVKRVALAAIGGR